MSKSSLGFNFHLIWSPISIKGILSPIWMVSEWYLITHHPKLITQNSSPITHFLSFENPQLIHHLCLALKTGYVFILETQNCQLFVGPMDWLGAVSTKWLPMSLMEPLLLSHISLHFQLKHEAQYTHKNCRATTLYWLTTKKKKFCTEHIFVFPAPNLRLFCLTHSPDLLSSPLQISLSLSSSSSSFFSFFFFLSYP